MADTKLGFALGGWGTRGRLLRTILLLFVMPGIVFGVFVGQVWQGVGFGFLFGIFFLLVFPTVFAHKVVRSEVARAESHQIFISREAVERHVAGTVVRQPWSAVTRVLELPNAFILMSGATAVGNIEKSAIPDQTALEAARTIISSARTIYSRPSAFLALESRTNEA